MNLIQLVFCLLTTIMIMGSGLINLLEPKLPQFISQSFRYGKFAATGKSKFAFEVPKSWFKHFYLLAFIEYSYILSLVTMVYIFDMKVPDNFTLLLDLICGKERIAYTPKNKVFIAVCLMTLQVYRRFYDTQKISVFGEKSKMNLSHYFMGLIHYPGAALAILCEAPLFADAPGFHDLLGCTTLVNGVYDILSGTLQNAPLNLLSTTLWDKLTILIFMMAWKHQYICTKILGNLRKNEKGKIVTSSYKLPAGDWFEYLSAPHQTAEIIMYSCLMSLLWNNVTWFFVFTWVLANQVETILLSHWWYQEKFHDFPKKRKALIPFVY